MSKMNENLKLIIVLISIIFASVVIGSVVNRFYYANKLPTEEEYITYENLIRDVAKKIDIPSNMKITITEDEIVVNNEEKSFSVKAKLIEDNLEFTKDSEQITKKISLIGVIFCILFLISVFIYSYKDNILVKYAIREKRKKKLFNKHEKLLEYLKTKDTNGKCLSSKIELYSDIEKKIKKIISNYHGIPIEKINTDSCLEDYALINSSKLLNIFMILEELGVNYSSLKLDKRVKKMKTIKDIIEYIIECYENQQNK